MLTCYRKDISCPKYTKVLFATVKNVAMLQTFTNILTNGILERNFQRSFHKQKKYINSEHCIFMVKGSHLNYL